MFSVTQENTKTKQKMLKKIKINVKVGEKTVHTDSVTSPGSYR